MGLFLFVIFWSLVCWFIAATIQFDRGWPWYRDAQGRRRFAFGKKRK